MSTTTYYQLTPIVSWILIASLLIMVFSWTWERIQQGAAYAEAARRDKAALEATARLNQEIEEYIARELARTENEPFDQEVDAPSSVQHLFQDAHRVDRGSL